MAIITSDEVRAFLNNMQGQRVTIKDLRTEFNILPGTQSFESIRVIIHRLVKEKVLREIGKRGEYGVVKQVKPVSVFGVERRPPIMINFPCDSETRLPMPFEEDLVIREGDLILIAGRSNYGKTAFCLNMAAENIGINPVLMGNEYTTIDDKPAPRFLSRLDAMNWVHWHNGTGDKFTLLPVRDDYAEHVIKDRLNLIDWINIETGEHYMIGSILESIKREVGKGVAVAVIQKAEGAESGRGGQFTKDFADVEILLDKLPESDDVLLTLGKVKESRKQLTGRTWAYSIFQGVKIMNLREVYKCKHCFGKGWVRNTPCDNCHKSGYVE